CGWRWAAEGEAEVPPAPPVELPAGALPVAALLQAALPPRATQLPLPAAELLAAEEVTFGAAPDVPPVLLPAVVAFSQLALPPRLTQLPLPAGVPVAAEAVEPPPLPPAPRGVLPF